MGSKTANPDDSASGRISLKCKKKSTKPLRVWDWCNVVIFKSKIFTFSKWCLSPRHQLPECHSIWRELNSKARNFINMISHWWEIYQQGSRQTVPPGVWFLEKEELVAVRLGISKAQLEILKLKASKSFFSPTHYPTLQWYMLQISRLDFTINIQGLGGENSFTRP